MCSIKKNVAAQRSMMCAYPEHTCSHSDVQYKDYKYKIKITNKKTK